ncbi:unnamed protein product [Acanthosepion pharaonis]|uniref:Uncharacterized protein n=1 Tax=Acanthosepion pharaonis TaxID=158019 RepID=A0A812AQN8_ACAPH|nr:unnamed protein product [Sepia pharaonis]
MITYLLYSVLFFIIVLSFHSLTQIRFHTLSGCNKDIHFLPLSVFPFFFPSFFVCIQFSFRTRLTATPSSSLWFSSFFPSSSLHNSAYNTFFSVFPFLSLHNATCNRGIYFLPLWISFFFKRRLNSQRINFSASSIWDSRTGIFLVIFPVRSCLG